MYKKKVIITKQLLEIMNNSSIIYIMGKITKGNE